MNTFKNGDRVQHRLHGTATVTGYDAARKLVQVVPDEGKDGGLTVLVHPVSLTPVPTEPKFKIGDRVSHPLHRDGTVEELQANGLYWITISGDRGYFAQEHQITHAVPEPKFTVRVMFTNGEGINSEIPMYQPTAQTYLTDISNWGNVESITITRAKG